MEHDVRIKNLFIEECFLSISNFIAFLRKEKDTCGTKRNKIWKESGVNIVLRVQKAFGLG